MKTLLFFLVLFLALVLFSGVSAASAAIIPFDLQGLAGSGLLVGNVPGPTSNGSGGEVGAGITYDTVSKLLTLNVGWGSSQGFSDLSSLSTNSHIHGPTPNANGNGFTEVASVIVGLSRSSNAVTGGVFTNPPILLSAGQEAELLSGRWYIDIHTANNGGGELRGFLVPVPEPASIALLGLGMIGLFGLASRRARRLP